MSELYFLLLVVGGVLLFILIFLADYWASQSRLFSAKGLFYTGSQKSVLIVIFLIVFTSFVVGLAANKVVWIPYMCVAGGAVWFLIAKFCKRK
jgi:hypothetical protein